MISDQQKIQHLHWRAGFGPGPESFAGKTLKEEKDSLFLNSKSHAPLTLKNWDPMLAKEARNMTPEDKAAYRKQERQARLQLNQDIINRFTYGPDSLRQKMTLFWMGHFACRIANPQFIVKYYNAINAHALGKFGNLLHEMIRNASLLQYLNNNLNRKSSPNENFARELMELFTLGINNYSETDVKEGARALTGWSFDRFGNFNLRKEHHDTGNKVFLGERGAWDGDDLVRILLTKKQCAKFITGKIYRFFVNEKPDENIITELSNQFFQSGYDLELLMRNMLGAVWFYNPDNIGQKIKSPLELLAGITRYFNLKFENQMTSIQIQKILGQMLFDPPNVAGWQGGNSWIDSSTLLYRMRLPQMLLQEAESVVTPKEEFDALETLRAPESKKVKATFDTTKLDKLFINIPDTGKIPAAMQFLLQVQPDKNKIALIENQVSGTAGRERIFKSAVYIMSLPEYQLC